MAKFEEEKVINALHPEKAEVGNKYWVADALVNLKKDVEKENTPYELKDVHKGDFYPFIIDTTEFQFIYPYEELSKQRMTNIQLMEWLIKGNGVYKNLYGYVHTDFPEKTELLDEEVDETIHIRPFGQTEWVEPTVDIYERDCKGGRK